jgi:tripartite-type tricarboxylate transporter receptor subunit TctC
MNTINGLRIVRALVGAAVAVGACAGIVAAQPAANFPSRPITVVVPYPPGGPPDVIARVVAVPLEKELGKPVIIENKPGASTSLGTNMAARAPADGYTLLAVEPGFVVTPNTLAKAGYDPVKDFKPISLTSRTFHTLGVSTNLPVNTVTDFIKLAREKPQEIKIGHSGIGTPPFLSALSFIQATGAPMLLVPYRGTALVVSDVVGGHVSGVFTGPSTTSSLAKDGKLKILGITGRSRLATLPDVPTFLESGIEMQGVNDGIWFGLVAPAATPDDIIAKLNAAVKKATQDPEVISKLGAQGISTIATSPQDMAKQIASEYAHWRDALNKAGIKPE